jgi:hypothetical protein
MSAMRRVRGIASVDRREPAAQGEQE